MSDTKALLSDGDALPGAVDEVDNSRRDLKKNKLTALTFVGAFSASAPRHLWRRVANWWKCYLQEW